MSLKFPDCHTRLKKERVDRLSERDLKIGRTEERETGNLVTNGLRQKGNQRIGCQEIEWK